MAHLAQGFQPADPRGSEGLTPMFYGVGAQDKLRDELGAVAVCNRLESFLLSG